MENSHDPSSVCLIMRYQLRERTKIGTIRLVFRFVWFPRKLNGEWRWFEWAWIKQEWISVDAPFIRSEYWDWVAWVNMGVPGNELRVDEY